MTVIAYEPPESDPAQIAACRPSGGIYDLPIVGRPAQNVREFYDDLRPQPDDSTGVVVGKQILRYGTVVAAGAAGVAAGAIIAL